MKPDQSLLILKALADQSRLMLVEALREPQCVEELAQRCKLAASTVSFHLAKLERAGLVLRRRDQYYAVYARNDALLDRSLRDLVAVRSDQTDAQEARLHRVRMNVIRSFMKNGRVARIPAQRKKRLVILEEILKRFESGQTYAEPEVDGLIKAVCDDYVTIRRGFIDEGMMTREHGRYRKVATQAISSERSSSDVPGAHRTHSMKTRQEIKREYKERQKPAGIFQVKNTSNGKVLLGSSLNLEGPLNSHKFMLTIGMHRNEALQKEWNTFGADKFIFEILEVVQLKDDPNFNLSDELALLEQIWIERLQPFGDRGYNTSSTIRQA